MVDHEQTQYHPPDITVLASIFSLNVQQLPDSKTQCHTYGMVYLTPVSLVAAY